MTPLQRSEDFYERWQQAIITGRRIDFDIIKEMKRVVEAAIKQDRAKQVKLRRVSRTVQEDKKTKSTSDSGDGPQKKPRRKRATGKKSNSRGTKGTK